MATFSIELPDRRVVDIEADDQETAVRGAKEWHAANPQPELSGTETARDVLESGGRGILKGATGAVTAPYRLVDWLGEKATGGGFLPNVEDTSAVSAALHPSAPRSRAGRYAETVGEFVGAGGVASGAGLALARRYPENWFLRSYASTPGAAVATDTAASVGGGLAVEAARENDVGTFGQVLAGLGGGLGGVGALATLSHGFNALPKIVASADGGLPGATPQAQARAYQVLADTLSRAGKTPDELRTALDDIYENTRFNSNSYAQEVTALGDLDESLTRLAGSIGRQNPEAARVMREFIEARHTGHTPTGVEATAMAERGLPTRQRFAEPMTGAQAEKALGRKFPGAESDVVPMGMGASVVDALRRAFLLEAHEHHGHGLTALRTEKALAKQMERNARRSYALTYRAGKNVDIAPELEPALVRWEARLANESEDMIGELTKLVHVFRNSKSIQRFDRNKRRMLDDEIGKAKVSGDRYRAMRLSEFKRDLMNAADNIQANNLGAHYSRARDMFASEADVIDALNLGRQAFRDDSEVTADIFKALTTEGERKAFRLGLLDSVAMRAQKTPRTHDFSKVFETERVEGILAATIPRSEKSGAVFANRPERFGQYLESRKRMVEGKNTIRGGSQTAKNQADDAAFDAHQAITNLMELGRSPSSWLMNRISDFAEKSFGESAEVTKALAAMLFTADRSQRLMILREVAARMPPDRMTRFRNMMSSLERAQARTATIPSIAAQTAPGQQQSP